jgi:S-adenosylmethionine:tRNA ribosyltransferase-isomerase
VVDRSTGQINDAVFHDIREHLPERSLLVLNNSKVVPARLHARKPTGGRVELFIAEVRDDYRWLVLIKPARRLKPGAELSLDGQGKVILRQRCPDGRFWVDSTLPAAKAYEQGDVPLPPYIRRAPEPDDRERYNTVYGREAGSAAAPTAGFHFSRELLAELKRAGHDTVECTLHVGLGTFSPVRTEIVESHAMHSESYCLTAEALARIREAKSTRRPVIAVGTTSVRVLETAADCLDTPGPLRGRTDIFIRPGYRFRVVDHLLTNFHTPYSTLLALVYAFGGTELTRRAYTHAVAGRYRFLSYGDCMFIR